VIDVEALFAEALACTCCASFNHTHPVCYAPDHDHARFGLFDPRYDSPGSTQVGSPVYPR
jgi:hypothetical protein